MLTDQDREDIQAEREQRWYEDAMEEQREAEREAREFDEYHPPMPRG